MKRVVSNSIIKLLIIVTISFCLRALIQNLNFAHFAGLNPDRKEILIYKDVVAKVNGASLMKPSFNDDYLNDVVDKYIEENACTALDYNVFIMNDERVSMFLDCGVKKLTLYDFPNQKALNLKDLIKDYSVFEQQVRTLLDLKYPSFVSDEVDVSNATYDIRDNELELFYSTEDYGDVSLKINNNEIEDLMNYDMTYDEVYENEEYTLDASKKTIAFSFDDGPSNYDLSIIDALVDAHATATFFLVGNRITSFEKSVNKMIENNMEVGNHSYNHKYMKKMSKTQVEDQINKTNNIYKDLTGKSMTLFRPPYGAINNATLIGTNMPSILWSIDTLDWKTRDKDKIYESIIENAKDGDIVLMHSLYEPTLEAVRMVLPELYKRGFQVVSVGELAEIKGVIFTAGTSYLSIKG